MFCAEAAGEVEPADSLLVHRGERTIVLPQQVPVLVRASPPGAAAPRRRLRGARRREALELHRLTSAALTALGRVYGPHGYNLGWNLGRVAGAGIVEHVHEHVVPRWGGDTNFMPVLADVKVLPEHLHATRERLAAAWPAG